MSMVLTEIFNYIRGYPTIGLQYFILTYSPICNLWNLNLLFWYLDIGQLLRKQAHSTQKFL